MKKDDALKKKSPQNSDKRMQNAENKGRKVATLAFVIGVSLIMFVNASRKEYNDQVAFLLWIYLAAESWPKYQFTKQKTYLLSMLACSFAACVNLYTFLFGA